MNRPPFTLPNLLLSLLFLISCTSKLPVPDKTAATELIKNQIIENGEMPGGNRIEIHQFEIKKIDAGPSPNTASVTFQIDYTRYPTSGLAPEYQTEEPMRQSEEHNAVLILVKKEWALQNISLR